ERASVITATARNTADYRLGYSGVQLADSEVIQKEKRQRTLYGNVVDAVVHQIFANRVVAAGKKGDLELGADAVGRADQHGTAKAGELVAGAEAADVGDHAAREGRPGEFLDGVDGAVGLVDIDAGVAVAKGFGLGQISV